jgi:photosystem II stability/assembly factor-like uncharacterized protein
MTTLPYVQPGLTAGSLPFSLRAGQLVLHKDPRAFGSGSTSRLLALLCLLLALLVLGGPAVGVAGAYPSAQRPLTACDFVAAGTGWTVGDDQVVLRTVTGGALWSRQRSLTPPAAALLDVFFTDRSAGWAAGEDGLLLSTVDSGGRWTVLRPVTGATWTAVAAPGGDVVLAAGWAEESGAPTGLIVSSGDGGATWGQVVALPGVRFSDVCFADRQHVWAVGARMAGVSGRAGQETLVVVRSVDGGVVWTEVPVAAIGLDPATASALYSIQSVGITEVWCAGRAGGAAAGRGLLLHSVDDGATWLASTSTAFTSFRDLAFAGRTAGWAVGTGSGAAIAATRDAGATWQRRRLPAGARAAAVDFVDARNGWVVGDTAKHRGFAARTRDAGATWVRFR